jgi:hypothetical protein
VLARNLADGRIACHCGPLAGNAHIVLVRRHWVDRGRRIKVLPMRSWWMSRIWSRMIDGGAPIWPTKTRDYVEYQQEKAYRELGDRLGDGSSPEAVYERLMSGRGAGEKQTPEQVRDELKLTGKFSPEDWEQVKRRIKEVEEIPRNFPAPTRYEDQRMYKLMNEIRLIIIERAAKVARPIKLPPFLATLPSGDVNAQIAFAPESKQPVLFFEQGLVWFLLNFSALASWVMPILPPEDLGDRTLQYPATVQRLHRASGYLRGIPVVLHCRRESARHKGRFRSTAAECLFAGNPLHADDDVRPGSRIQTFRTGTSDAERHEQRLDVAM